MVNKNNMKGLPVKSNISRVFKHKFQIYFLWEKTEYVVIFFSFTKNVVSHFFSKNVVIFTNYVVTWCSLSKHVVTTGFCDFSKMGPNMWC